MFGNEKRGMFCSKKGWGFRGKALKNGEKRGKQEKSRLGDDGREGRKKDTDVFSMARRRAALNEVRGCPARVPHMENS